MHSYPNKFKPPTDTKSVTGNDNISIISETPSSLRSENSSSNQKHPTGHCATSLYNGEIINKSDRIVSTLGSLEELLAYVGIIKAEYLNTNTDSKFDIDNSSKMFLAARLTQIQEVICDISHAIGTSKKIGAKYENSRFGNDQRIMELENEMSLMTDVDLDRIKADMKEKPLQIIPGTYALEAHLMYARSLCRKAERQVCSCKNSTVGIFPDEKCVSYLNRLGDYLLALSIHVLHMQSKEPLKKLTRSNKNSQPNLK